MDIKQYQEAGRGLYHRLHLPTYPVGVKFIKSEREIQEGFFRPSDTGKKWSLCQAYTYARSWGMHSAMTEQDNFCVPASAMHHWVDTTADEFIESQVRQGWHQDRKSEQNRFDCAMRKYQGADGEKLLAKAKEYIGFLCGPLPEIMFQPDAIVVYGDGSHITHLIQALCFKYESPIASFFEGFLETCYKGGLLPFLTQRPQVLIPGSGDRTFAAIAKDEIAISFPSGLLEEILRNMFKTGGKMNIGLPVKRMMPEGLTESITPGFTYLREVVESKKKL